MLSFHQNHCTLVALTAISSLDFTNLCIFFSILVIGKICYIQQFFFYPKTYHNNGKYHNQVPKNTISNSFYLVIQSPFEL